MKRLLWLAMAVLAGAGFGAPMETGVVIAVQVMDTDEIMLGKDATPLPALSD